MNVLKMPILAGVIAVFLSLPATTFADTAGPYTAGTVTGTNWTYGSGSLKIAAESSEGNRCIYNSTSQDELILTNFGFDIPNGLTINGITVTREGSGTSNSGPSRRYRMGLTKDGSNLAGTRKANLILPKNTDDTVDVGSSTDLWGTTWTAAEINSSTFGVLISDNDTTADPLRFDRIQVTVDYTLVTRYWVGPAGGAWNLDANWSTASNSCGTGGGASYPVAGDTAIFDGSCTNNITLTANAAAASITNAGGYTGTFDTASYNIDLSGDFQWDGGIFTAGSSTITVAGNWDSTNGTFTYGTSTVVMTGPTKTMTATANSDDFYNLTIDTGASVTDNSGLIIQAGGLLTVSGTLTIASGKTLQIKNTANMTINSTGTLTITGSLYRYMDSVSSDFTNDGTINGSGSFIFVAAWNSTAPLTATDFGDLDIGFWTHSPAGTPATFVLGPSGATLTTTGDLLVYQLADGDQITVDNTTFDLAVNVDNLTVGSPSNVMNSGKLIAGSATYTITGNVLINDTTIASEIDVDADTATFNVGGNWTNNDVFTAGLGTVKFDGTGAQTVTTGGSNWNTIEVTNASAGGVTFADGFTTAYFTDATPNSTLYFAYQDTGSNYFEVTASGGLTLTGATGQLIKLRRYGGSGTDKWEIYPSGGSWSVSYVDVENSVNSASTYINPSNSTDSGNNLNWFTPTLVELTSFNVIGYYDKVLVEWETDSELNNAGFNIYRSQDPNKGYIKINSDLIPGLGNSAMGKKYEFWDYDVIDGLTYYYMLEDVEFDGKSTMHGPVVAHPGLDSDGDVMTDDWENYYGLNPYDPADTSLDPDNDGFTSLEEFIQETDPTVPDIPEPPVVDEDGVKIIQSDDYGVVLELITSSFEIETKLVGEETYQVIKLPYPHGQTTEIGKPQVPVKGVLLGVPFNSSITINAAGYEEEILSGYNLYPESRIHLEKEFPERRFIKNRKIHDELSHKFEFVKNTRTYSQDRFYPDSSAEVSPVGSLRRQDVAKLNLYPIQFNPATGELRFYRRIRIQVIFANKAQIDLENTHRLPASYKRLYKGLLHNYGDVKSWKRRPRKYKGPDQFIRGTAYKISVNEEGIYRLTWQDLYDAGLNPDRLNPRKIKIYNQGKQIPIYVAGEKDGRFDYGDYIEFYAEAVHTRYTSTDIYWLTTGGKQGLRMGIKSPLNGTGQNPISFLSDIHQEKDEMYWMDIPDKGYVDDHWFFSDSLLAPSSVDFTIPLSAVAAVQEEAMVEIALQGISHGFSDPDHHTRIYLNGYLVDDTTWDGDVGYIRQLNVPQSFLVEGDNTITIELPGDTGAEIDFVLADWFGISYWRQFKAEGNSLEFDNQGQGLYSYRISNFTEDDIEIFDITDPEKVKRIVHFDIEEEGGTYTVSFNDRFKKQRNRNYIVLSPSGIKRPTSIVKDERSNLRFRGNQADYIIITHEDFYDGILPLAEHRAAQGLSVKVVKVQDIYDEFNYGIFSPEAIKTFLEYAYSEWMEPAPTYVLLVGDGTYDYQDNEGLGSKNYVPTYMVHSLDFGETGSDNWFVCLDGEDDVLPDMFIGRFPVYSVEQLNTLVYKTINYETTPSDNWTKEVTLVADNLEGAFEAISEGVIDYLPFEYQTNKIYLNDYADPRECKADIIDAINQGTLILNYAGHGSVVRWAHESILTMSDIPYLTNLDRLTFISTMTCANGYFVYPPGYFNSIAEELLYSPSGGAVAILAPTGISYPINQELLNRGLFESIFMEDNFLVGPAIAHAKLRVFENAGKSGENVIRTFLLFGDPALELKR